ncbi:energy transducer TonB [Pararhizobium polonicum]|uniref:Protein TonB n=1 Tax=Pararhizobium polonicum TaxID=1612624 RepID=A0A1C7NU24_9HYPH|nr:energy transducer TonB [Pararhizobium polonicum]OBZ92502.1 energy transducer TonB [Pararhizobium polonicum]
MRNTIKWTGAIVLSLLAHAGTAKLFEPDEKPPEMAMVEGGEEMEVAVLGNAFEDALQAGDPDEEIQPEEIKPEEVEPPLAEVAEVPPVQSEITAETPTDIVPTEADVILPAEEILPVVAEQPEITAIVAPAEIVVPEEKPEPEEVKPEPEKKPEPKKKPEKEKPKKVVKKQAGDEGKQQTAANKGQEDGVEGAVASNAQGNKGKVSQAEGDAAASNYKGKLRSKVSRHFRYPRSANRAGVKGVVMVGFTVSSSGEVSGIGIVSGSGSSVLDEAALNAVRKAQPFPKFPEGVNRSSWRFTFPLQFAQ